MVDADEIPITVHCPVEECNKTKEIKIPQYLFENKRMHLLKIPIHSGMCCEHEFIAFVSTKNYQVRGYEKIDTTVDLTQLSDTDQKDKLNLEDILGKYGTLATSSILIALLLNKSIVLLRTKYEKNFEVKYINLLRQMVPSEYPSVLNSLQHLLDSDLRKAKIKDALVISPNGLVANTPWQNILDKDFREILNKALDILDKESQCLLIQNELTEKIKQAEFIVKTLEKGEIFEEDLIKQLENEFGLKVTNSYLKLLKMIVSERFKKNTKNIKIRSFSKLKEGLW